MGNYTVKGIDTLSAFKYGLLLSTAASLTGIVVMIFRIIYKIILAAIHGSVVINLLISGILGLFFYIIYFAIATLVFAGGTSLFAYLYNKTLGWLGGLQIEVEENHEEVKNDDSAKTGAPLN